MARIVGGIGTSHIPAIGLAMARNQCDDPYWHPFFDAYRPVRAWLESVRPTVAIVVYNDHGLNFFLDKMPTFASAPRPSIAMPTKAGACPRSHRSPATRPFPGISSRALAAADFDLTTCQEMLVDHGFVVPMQLLWPGDRRWPVRTIPIHVNTVQHPLPTPRRCLNFGEVAGPGHRSLARGRACRRARHRRALAPARRPPRRLHQQALRSVLSREDRARAGVVGALLDSRPGGASPARRAPSWSSGSSCAARSARGARARRELPRADLQHGLRPAAAGEGCLSEAGSPPPSREKNRTQCPIANSGLQFFVDAVRHDLAHLAQAFQPGAQFRIAAHQGIVLRQCFEAWRIRSTPPHCRHPRPHSGQSRRAAPLHFPSS